LWRERKSKNMHSVKFLIDADMPRSIVEIIRSFGFDVEDVREMR